jgi:hypothetical protein
MTKRNGVAGTASDPTIEFAKLEIDGKQYRLGYDFNAIAEAEEVTGSNLLQGLLNGGNWTARQMRGLLYAALHVAHPRITVEEVGKLIRLDTMIAVQRAVIMAYNLSLPEEKRQADPFEEAPEESPGPSGAPSDSPIENSGENSGPPPTALV